MVASIFLGVAIVTGIIAIVVALYAYQKVKQADEGNEKMKEVSSLIEEGSYSFIKVQ